MPATAGPTPYGGRYKSCLVDHESYVPRHHRHIDLNSLRARMTDDATRFPWSGATVHCEHRHDSLLTPHLAYAGLGTNDSERGAAFRTLLREGLSDDLLVCIVVSCQSKPSLPVRKCL